MLLKSPLEALKSTPRLVKKFCRCLPSVHVPTPSVKTSSLKWDHVLRDEVTWDPATTPDTGCCGASSRNPLGGSAACLRHHHHNHHHNTCRHCITITTTSSTIATLLLVITNTIATVIIRVAGRWCTCYMAMQGCACRWDTRSSPLSASSPFACLPNPQNNRPQTLQHCTRNPLNLLVGRKDRLQTLSRASAHPIFFQRS